MGIIKAAIGAAGGTLADEWQEVLEPDRMGEHTLMVKGIPLRRRDGRNQNKKGSENIISDGSVIHVYPGQCMLLIDGGKVIDYTAEEGYYQVHTGSAPSLFQGELKESVRDAFERVKFGGISPVSQKVYYINLKEIKGIRFGTRNPVNYFDQFYNMELNLRAHGVYSIRVTNPLLFFTLCIPQDRDRVEIEDINEQLFSEFLGAFQAAINQMSVDGLRISFVTSKSLELAKYMSGILDDDWKKNRGIEIQSVGISSLSYDEESQKLIHMRNQGAALSDPTVREGYVQAALARGMEAAGSNKAGSMNGFLGMNMGMQTAGNFMGAASQSNQQQRKEEQVKPENTGWKCSCGASNTGRFCSECGKERPISGWICSCGAKNTGNFCSECGKPRVKKKIRCDKCGYEPDETMPIPKFCPECGDPINERDFV